MDFPKERKRKRLNKKNIFIQILEMIVAIDCFCCCYSKKKNNEISGVSCMEFDWDQQQNRTNYYAYNKWGLSWF